MAHMSPPSSAAPSSTDASSTDASSMPASEPLKTPLYDFHLAHGGKVVDFAGYLLPVNYALGVMGEHLHCRSAAGLFDVSHMGQAWLRAAQPGSSDAMAALMEELVPGGVTSLVDHKIRYTVLTHEEGGIWDDLMVTRRGDDLWLVVNAACKNADFDRITRHFAGRAELEPLNRALLALQGPKARAVLGALFPETSDLPFMSAQSVMWQGHDLFISCCGYTGEDGFEISLPEAAAAEFAETLLLHDDVALCGLGARDSLRLEAGLCLYGSDIDLTTSPAEADLMWTIPKRRRALADFPGASVTLAQHDTGVPRRRVGLRILDRAPARAHTRIETIEGEEIGEITSGGYAPSLSQPIAMGYVRPPYDQVGTQVVCVVRGKKLSAEIVAMPFVPHQYAVSSKEKNA